MRAVIRVVACTLLACSALHCANSECVVAPHEPVLGTTFRGCYDGTAGPQMLRLLRSAASIRSSTAMTPHICMAHCKAAGTPFFALHLELTAANSETVADIKKAGLVEEFVCNCSDSPPKTSTIVTGNRALTQCSKPCPNATGPQEFCGHTAGTLVYAIDEIVDKMEVVTAGKAAAKAGKDEL